MKPFQKKSLSGLWVIVIFTFLPVYSDGGITEEAIQGKVYVEMKAGKEQAYLNEKVPLTIKLYASGYSLRDIQSPQLHHQDFSIQEFETPVQKNERLNGIEFETLEFKTAFFGKRPGKFRLGPVRLQCTLLVQRNEGTDSLFPASKADRYFGASEAHPLSLVSNEIPFGILPLPKRGKPRDFGGAVGNFRISVEVFPKEVKVGEPITLKVTVEGEGNLNSIGPPEIEPGAGFRIYEPQAEQKEGIKTYEQVLVPQSETLREIPEIRFSFFDPGKRSYQTVRKGPIPVEVRKNEGEDESKTGKRLGPGTLPGGKAGLERDIVPVKRFHDRLKKRGDFLYQNRLYANLHLFPFFLLLSLWIWNRRKEKLRTDLRYARLLRARKLARKGLQKTERILKEGKPIELYDSVFKTLQGYLGNRFDLPSKSMTGDEVDHFPKSERADELILKKIQDVFSRCDQARYAPFEFSRAETEETFQWLKEILNHLEAQK